MEWFQWITQKGRKDPSDDENYDYDDDNGDHFDGYAGENSQ